MIYGVPSKQRVEELKKLYPRRFVSYEGKVVHNVPDGKRNIKKKRVKLLNPAALLQRS